MPRVLLTITEVGVAIEVQERLEHAGHAVTWDTERRGALGDDPVDIVIMPGGADLGARIDAWRRSASVPAMVVIGDATDGPESARRGVQTLTSTEPLIEAIEAALARRFGGGISRNIARVALGIDDCPEDALAAAIIARGRSVDENLVRAALESRRLEYVTVTPLYATLRSARALEVPEVELGETANGSVTLSRVVEASSLSPLAAGQRIWSMASAGALRFDRDPPDDATPERRKVRATRAHIRRRSELTMPTAYDVLDVTRGAYVEDVEEAVAALGYRFSPQALTGLDLGDLADAAPPLWERILEARAALYYEAGQKQLDAFIDQQLSIDGSRLASSWGRPQIDPKSAAAHFARGQTALSNGEVFEAVAAMAAAARSHPDHPIYEAYLAWTRYRSEVARGADRAKTANSERRKAEQASLGRRPFAQALVALGLLCVADGDTGAARWHLTESLALNPDLPAAKLILGRL